MNTSTDPPSVTYSGVLEAVAVVDVEDEEEEDEEEELGGGAAENTLDRFAVLAESPSFSLLSISELLSRNTNFFFSPVLTSIGEESRTKW